jgi:CHAT domain-containing protein
VSQAQLEVTVLRFRQLIQNRFSDINELKATGKQLYSWLIEPLEKELKANDIHNLVFSLDSATRYIPMSALFDGEKYLVENYSVSTVLSANLTKTQPVLSSPNNTPKATANASEATPLYSCGEGCRLSLSTTEPKNSGNSGVPLPNTQNPIILGLGVSEAIAGFQALPNVPSELDSIVRQEASDSTGIYPGQKFLDKTFDFFALRDNLSGRQILHIATHSEFVPGRAYKSFLLLGTGEKLAIPDIETWLNLQNINLVVLSACETALGGPGLDGRELTGMGYYFLKGGARTVMASLWHVDDLSTRLLMEQFYKNLARGTLTSPVAKSDALRQAQLALLNGKYTTDAQTQSSLLLQRLSAMRSSSVTQLGENLPLSTNVNNKNFFSHPYYWAPFILMGSGL